MKHIYNKKALVLRGSKMERFGTIIKEHMGGLDLKHLLSSTASDKIHIWNQPKQKGQNAIRSEPTDDPEVALEKYNKGSSLYFGANVKFRDLYMKHLNFQMGQNFAGYYPACEDITSLDQQGEIETFVSRAGNYTDWHTDFQENFTI